MKLLVDCGNTRLKWRMVDSDVHREASVPWDQFDPQALLDDWQQALVELGLPTRNPIGMICSVAPAGHSAKAWAALQAFCSVAGARQLRVTPVVRLQIDGVEWRLTTDYVQLEELGRDRWAAALGFVAQVGHGSHAESMRRKGQFSCALVSAGTATVVDRVSAHWDGTAWHCTLSHGQIQPGLYCSVQALGHAAPALRPALEQAALSLASTPSLGSTRRAVSEGLMASQLGSLLWLERCGALDGLWVHGGNASWWLAALDQSPWSGQWPCVQVPLIFAGLEAALTLESSQSTGSLSG